MPYASDHAKEKQAAAAKRYTEKHPDRVREQKADWYERNRQRSLDRVAKWRKENPEAEFNGHLRRKYGITREQYNAMLEKQCGKCAICGGSPVGRVKGRPATRFDVDHDHETKAVRGLVCHPCNVMLGQARDRIEVLQAAIFYLQCSRSHPKQKLVESSKLTLS